MKKKWFVLAIVFCYCFANKIAHAVCVKNETDFNLYYEIYNQNTNRVPKERYHDGTLSKNQKNCHAHSAQEGDDWTIYRKDLIKVYKVRSDTNQKELVCNKHVNGILNTLEVSFISDPDKWWCLDRSDYQD